MRPPNPRLPLRRTRRAALGAFAGVLAALGALWAAVPPAPFAASDPGTLRSRIDAARAHERSLSADASGFGALASQLDGDIAVLERRQAEVQSELDAKRAELQRTREQLARERARLAALRLRLAHGKRVLARRLRDLYEAGKPDAITIVFTSHGLGEVLERGDFLRRINDQDRRIVRRVRDARDASVRATRALAALEAGQSRAAAAVQAQAAALASMQEALAAKQAAAARARAARLEALRATRGNRRHLERELSDIESQQSAAFGAASGGPWAIPAAIVNCESGGQNLPPNFAGASGYYQILPSTWKLFGGSGPAAYQASKAEQDRVAARIWNGGAGAGNWVCAALVRAG